MKMHLYPWLGQIRVLGLCDRQVTVSVTFKLAPVVALRTRPTCLLGLNAPFPLTFSDCNSFNRLGVNVVAGLHRTIRLRPMKHRRLPGRAALVNMSL